MLDKTIVFKADEDFNQNCNITFSEDLRVEVPSSQVAQDTHNNYLDFSVRTNYNSYLKSINTLEQNNNCFWVAMPQVSSLESQIFYIQSPLC